MKILVTGGAGFIGSHIVDGLIEKGHSVRVFDNLTPQVHGHAGQAPSYLNPEAEFFRGDVRDKVALAQALKDVNAVFHEAAVVGVGQSMYEIQRYVEHNTLGTSVLLELLSSGQYKVEKLIVASSMSIYGEGKYHCSNCGIVHPQLRPERQLEARSWEVLCPNCGIVLDPLATDEQKPLFPTSIYAINKRDQEEMCLAVGRAYGIPTVALRYFNVYGTRQALSNPYTGVAAIFSSTILNGRHPLIFEDGLQSRDFVHVRDIVQANLLVLENPSADYQALNVGTGRQTSINSIAEILSQALGRPDLQPKIINKFRAGDIRHCFADVSRIKSLGYSPQVTFEQGISELIHWVRKQQGVRDRVDEAVELLDERGLIR